MKLVRSLRETFRLKGYKPITVWPLAGYACHRCRDSILTTTARSLLQARLAEERARQDAARLPASELMLVEEARRELKVSRQALHQMMRAGRLPYVFLGGRPIPTREGVYRHKCRPESA
jgi:hypothetical protein